MPSLTSWSQHRPPDDRPPGRVLVFLPAVAAKVIVSKLEEHGHSARSVQSVPELVCELRSNAYSLAVTTRADIDIVRDTKPIPVVNIEVFFHTLQPAGNGTAASKQFDGKAFMDRITLLREPRRIR